MNIGQAKEYIKQSVKLYLKKNAFGEYEIPVVRQRPIFLLGAPGIGKTAIMEQIAQELGIALVSYSMTHHTRQSALGLPYIEEKMYDGQTVKVSEYTMSEIIASVYDTMEESGVKQGILFLDEINCVSETLAPSMLQFLQYKVFGKHRVPEGWVIVTAGNPPQYNKSVREFDIVTMDRLKLLEVEADYETFKAYAQTRKIHQAIVSYLEINKADFYRIEMTPNGRSYVTSRGWEDLSVMLRLYEAEGLKVDETLIAQYLHHDRVVKEFSAYYDLYQKYKRSYPVMKILNGEATEEMITRASEAGFEERLSILGMLSDKLFSEVESVMTTSVYLKDLMPYLQAVKQKSGESVADMLALIAVQENQLMTQMEQLMRAGALSDEDRMRNMAMAAFLKDITHDVKAGGFADGESAFATIKERFDSQVDKMKTEAMQVKAHMHALFAFVEKAFEDGNEMLLFVTSLTVSDACSRFISSFGSEDYEKHNQKLMLTERQHDIVDQIKSLNLS